jgi:GntR family transcriptional regulator
MSPLRHTGIPLYHQLREIFAEKIESGEWKPDALIPNEASLCEEYGVSRGPLRQALEHLVREGRLARKQGKGTWVLPPRIERGLGGLYSFTTLIEQRGLRPGARLLSFETVPASVGVSQALALPEGAAVAKIRRLRLADDEPLILETVCVPAQVCPGLTEEALGAAPLYDLLRERYGVAVLRARQYFEPALADEYEAGVLGIGQGAPVLLLHNVTYASGDQPVVFSKAIMRGDRVRYYVELSQAVVAPG